MGHGVTQKYFLWMMYNYIKSFGHIYKEIFYWMFVYINNLVNLWLCALYMNDLTTLGCSYHNWLLNLMENLCNYVRNKQIFLIPYNWLSISVKINLALNFLNIYVHYIYILYRYICINGGLSPLYQYQISVVSGVFNSFGTCIGIGSKGWCSNFVKILVLSHHLLMCLLYLLCICIYISFI